MKVIKDQEGIGLVEVIFSLGIAVVILTSLVALSVFTLRTSTQNKLLIKGSSLATQQLELARAYRDTRDTWFDFVTGMALCDEGVSCYVTNALVLVDNDELEDIPGAEGVTVFFTTADCTNDDPENDLIVDLSADCVRISVQARWMVGGSPRYVHNYTDLSKW
ncbi:MAG: hypothetical protein WC243_01440 [Patescibacteria group bacterium]